MDNFDQKLRDAWQTDRPDFEAGFEERLFARLPQKGQLVQGQFGQSLWQQFRIVGTAAAVALFLLLGQIYSSEQKIDLDTVLGVEQVEENQSLLYYDINS